MTDVANRIDPSIPLEDELDGQKFFDAMIAADLAWRSREALERLDYSTAARLWRAIKAA